MMVAGTELWRTDGTSSGTVLVEIFVQGPEHHNLRISLMPTDFFISPQMTESGALSFGGVMELNPELR